MIPDLIDIGGPWEVLPPGIHDATLPEVEQRFAYNQRRKELFDGLQQGCKSLKVAGCKVIFLDGSYVTEKPRPGDFDVCWGSRGVNPAKLDPVLLDFANLRANQKAKFGGEFFPSSARADGGRTFVEFFQTDKDTGSKKGIIRIQWREEV